VRQRLAQAAAAFALACCLGGTAPAALAQSSTAAAPGTKQMIEALLPSGTMGRNLLVRQSADTPAAAASGTAPAAPAAPGATAAPAPSLSLAIQFEANSSRVRPESGGLLGDLVAAMISPELKDVRFVIEGHTDARGNAAANRRLSQERAEEVRQYLMLLGVHASRLKAVGKGSSEPANTKDPLAAENRRVRVVTVQ
jgi:outer membrane protein OmpA-like peptidoglycan-associated protein